MGGTVLKGEYKFLFKRSFFVLMAQLDVRVRGKTVGNLINTEIKLMCFT